MIVLDSNVISELMRPQPVPEVVEWVLAVPSATLFTTCITEAEILYGIHLLPAGKRRDAIQKQTRRLFAELLAGRVLPFNSACAEPYARIVTARRAAGRPISQADAQIASICIANGAKALVSRNVQDFERCGIEVINPFR
ncbi:MAG: type II toxin-antitoxin system VapC family toxin [Betaproteobacteria bacterium]|nr:type II toxin-antitoxin system VapC family toxin [Betaproteobacteria bacterium]